MKTFIVSFTTNYGLSVMIINSEDVEIAKKLAKEHGAWDGFEIEELNKEPGIVFIEHS